MDYYIKTLIAAAFGTLGFGMIFKIKPKSLALCTLSGVFTWGIALICEALGLGIFTMNLVASIFAMIFSMFAAIKMKIPSTILVTTCIIPLVPGGGLYYTMQSIIMKDFMKAYEYGGNTILTAVGIAGGILIGSIIFSAIHKPLPKKRFKFIGINSMNQTHYMHLEKEPFSKIISGEKKVELRLFDEKRKKIRINDLIEFQLLDSDKKITVKVTGINVFPTFKELYESIPLEDLGYSESDVNAAKPEDMLEYYSFEDQIKHSVVALRIEKVL